MNEDWLCHTLESHAFVFIDLESGGSTKDERRYISKNESLGLLLADGFSDK
jgi:hypothetical protein